MRAAPDVVIVGAGIFGAAAACFLAQRRLRVLVLEQREIASGATGWTSGIIRVHYSNEPEARLALLSRRYFRDWSDTIGGTAGFRETGFLRIVGAHDRDHLQENVAMLQSIGTPVEFLEPVDLRALQPDLAVDDVGGAAYEPEGGYAVGVEATRALIERAIAEGADVRQGVMVTELRTPAGRISGVETTEGTIACGRVLVAAGAWSGPLLRPLGIELPVRVKLIRAGLISHPVGQSVHHMTTYDDAIGTYYRPDGGTRTEFGLRYVWDVKPEYGPGAVGLDVLTDGARHLVRRIPALADGGLVRGWGAPDGFSSDGASIFGAAPGIEGLYLAIAGSGTGFKIAPAAGLGLAELISGEPRPEVDLGPFRPGRFTEGTLLHRATDYRRPRWRDEPVPD
jgi:glycine/D-amino acid oxidase-like deaminating enzyme